MPVRFVQVDTSRGLSDLPLVEGHRNITDMFWDSGLSAWRGDVGLDLHPALAAGLTVTSLYSWSPEPGRDFLFFVRSGVLQYYRRSSNVTIGTGFISPVFSSVGRDLYIVDGSSGQTLRIDADGVVYPLGFRGRPNTIIPRQVDAANTSVATLNPQENMLVMIPQRGLGSLTSGDENTYRWKVALVRGNGSEGPHSIPSDDLTWTTGATPYRYGVVLEGLPVDTNAHVWRIFRTKRDGGEFYFCADVPINSAGRWIDSVPDTDLTYLAPESPAPWPCPSPGSMSYLWGRLFITDQGQPTRLYFSEQNQTETFGLLNFHDLRTAVRKIVAHYDALWILCDDGAYVLSSPDTSPLQVVSNLPVQDAIAVPGLGMVMLGQDGRVYTFSGGLTGGATVTPQVLSEPIHRRVLKSRSKPNWRLFYSNRYSEIWLSNPGNEAWVYHLDLGGWSRRNKAPYAMAETKWHTLLGLGGIYSLSHSGNQPAQIQSHFYDFGDPKTNKIPQSVDLRVMGNGAQVSLVSRKNGSHAVVSTAPAVSAISPHGDAPARYGSYVISPLGVWTQPEMIPVRIDTSCQSALTYSWGTAPSGDLYLLGCEIGIGVSGVAERGRS